jgi:DNA-binding CsgD family transcriptional regulator
MTVKEFKIWLINNDHTHKTLSEKLGITERTISNYVAAGRFPVVFTTALKGLENDA